MKIVKIAGIVIGVLIVAFVVFILTFDVGKYKGVIESQAKAATGRDVSIGSVSMGFSLNPAIILTDVKLGNAPWGSRPQMVTLKRVEAHTQLIPLISGTVNITSLSVEDPDVLLETDKSGKGNWEFSTPSANANPSSGGGSTPLSVSDISVKGLKLGYRDNKEGTTADVAAKSLAVDIDGPVQNLNVSSVDMTDGNVAFKTRDASGTATLAAFTMKAKGKITDMGITSLKASDAKVNYKTEGAPLDVALDKLSLDDSGKLDVAGKYNAQDFKASGTLAPIAALVSSKKPFPVKVEAEGMGLKGNTDLVVDLSQKNPSAKGTVTIPELDLTKLMPASAATAQANATKNKPAPGEHMFPDTPLPWDQLTGATLDVKANIGKVILPSGLVLTDVTLPVVASTGKLNIKQSSFTVAGGNIVTDLDAEAGSKSVDLKLTAKNLTAERVAKEMKKGDFITQGPLDLDVNIRGAGNSVRAIMASANGSIVIGMGEAKVKTDSLNFMGGDLITQVLGVVNPLSKKEPYTITHCAVVNLQVVNGVANSNNGIALSTDKMTVTSSGTINFGTERVDLSVNPKASGGLGVGLGQLASAVRVTGPIASPNIGIDKQGAVKTLGMLGAAFATGGASILAQGAKDRVTPSGDVCQTARTWTQNQKK